MDQDTRTWLAAERKRSSRSGGQVFAFSAALLMYGIGLLILSVMFSDWLRHQSYSYSIEQSFYEYIGKKDTSRGIILSICSALVFVTLAWLIGRMAGRAIQIQKRGIGWVGPLAMVLPTFLGCLLGICLFALTDDSMMNHMQRRPLENFILPLFLVFFLIFVPAA